MSRDYTLTVDMTVTPAGTIRDFSPERLASILASTIPLIVDAYCDGVVGGKVSVRTEEELFGAVEEVGN